MSTIKRVTALGKDEVFYDLGSGSGKVLLAASLCYPFAKCTLHLITGKGIEFLETLYKTSMELKIRTEAQQEQIE